MKKNLLCSGKFQPLGFLYSNLLSESAGAEEVDAALIILIENCNDASLLELYVELLGHTDDDLALIKAFRNIKTVHWYDDLSEDQSDALTGITYKRGITPYEHTPALEKRAKRALEKHPEVEELFRKVFPFIEF